MTTIEGGVTWPTHTLAAVTVAVAGAAARTVDSLDDVARRN